MFKINYGLLAAGVVALSVSQAGATLIGDTISCSAESLSTEFPLICSPNSAVVTEDGAEFVLQSVEGTMVFNLVEVDPGGTSITIENALPGQVLFFLGDGVTLSDLDWVDDPSAIILGIGNFTTNLGATASIVSFGPHSVTVDLSDLIFDANSFLTFDLITGTAVVPLPPTAFLLLGGLAGIGFVRKRRRA
jgi:hypothetical protein